MTSLFVSAADFSPLDVVLGMIGPRNGREKIFPISRDALDAILIMFDEADRVGIFIWDWRWKYLNNLVGKYRGLEVMSRGWVGGHNSDGVYDETCSVLAEES